MPIRSDYRVTLRPIGSVRPSTYNPRAADERRLELVKLSIAKLGWLLPIVADQSGEIVSGHQRHFTAERLGLTELPVLYLPTMELNARKALNLLFNRATNDLERTHNSGSLTEDLLRHQELLDQVRSMPDVPPERMFPCAGATLEPLHPIAVQNRKRFVRYAMLRARQLYGSGVSLPIVLDEDGNVVNGIGRLQYAVESGAEEWHIVRIGRDIAAGSAAMLNLLTMDFDIHTRYADLLRYNSFRRVMHVKAGIGVAFIFDLFGPDTKVKDIDWTPADQARWKRHYGTSVLDFGCGLDTERDRLTPLGVSYVGFEPFRLKPGLPDIDPDRSRNCIVNEFLPAVASGVQFQSVFQNSVMNSVPFRQDREHIVTLISALCGPSTKAHVCAASEDNSRWQQVNGVEWSAKAGEHGGFAIDYEKGIMLAEIGTKPKVQKYHSMTEWKELWELGFESVFVRRSRAHTLVCAVCTKPRPINPERLKAAIEFEFDLPYPDGTRMGLVAEAKRAFGQRLGIPDFH